MRKKEQILFEDNSTKMLAFYSRLINLIEDLIDDAYCKTVYISGLEYTATSSSKIVLEPIECQYDPYDSLRVFSSEWDIDNIVLGKGTQDYRVLYDLVKEKYIETLHYIMKSYASKTYVTKKEYFLAVSFNGKAVIIEGDPERVRIPLFSQCFSAHTHPSTKAAPSIQDLATIITIMLNRGIGHAIETPRDTLIFYRVAPLTEDDIIILRRIEKENNIEQAIDLVKSIPRIRMVYIG